MDSETDSAAESETESESESEPELEASGSPRPSPDPSPSPSPNPPPTLFWPRRAQANGRDAQDRVATRPSFAPSMRWPIRTTFVTR